MNSARWRPPAAAAAADISDLYVFDGIVIQIFHIFFTSLSFFMIAPVGSMDVSAKKQSYGSFHA